MFSASEQQTSTQPSADRSLSPDLERLRQTLISLAVIDKDNQPIGDIKDLIVPPSGHLQLVIAQPDAYRGWRYVLVNSKLVRDIQLKERRVVVNVTQADVSYFPEYRGSTQEPQELHESQNLEDETLVAIPLNDLEVATEVHSTPGNATPEAPLASSKVLASDLESPLPPLQPELQVREETAIPLLEERLVVNSTKRKIGEVVIRKQIATRIVEVPVRYETLLIEQISPEQKQLAEVKLPPSTIDMEKPVGKPVVQGSFTSPRLASQVLNTIAKTLHHRCRSIRIELELDDETLRDTYQEWFNQYSQNDRE